MNIKEFTRQRLEESAKKAQEFWADVKARLSKELLENEDEFKLIDIQEISDDCLDLIILRKSKELDITQLEHFRIVAEKRLFKKPKLKIYSSSGPFAEEFFSKNEYEKYT